MRSQVPYLSRLARQGSDPATLRPPRQLFVGDTSMAAGSAVGENDPGRPAGPGADTGPATGPATAARSQLGDPPSAFAAATGEHPSGARAGGTGAATAGRDPEALVPSAPIRPGGRVRDPAATDASVVSTAGQSLRIVDPPSATPGLAPLAAPPGGPAPTGDPRAAPDAARGRTPASWSDPLWQAPVELPPALGPASVAGDSARRTPIRSGRDPAAGRSGSRSVEAADSPSGQVADDAEISVTLGHAVPAGDRERSRRSAIGDLEPRAGTGDPGRPGAISGTGDRHSPDATGGAGGGPGAIPGTGGRHSPDATGGPGGSRATAAVHDLLPPPTSASRSLRSDTAGVGRDSPSPMRPSVSIGSIEVTVVPPPHGAPPTHDPRAARAVRNRSRPVPRPGVDPGVDRLRDGRRRWYGIAQG
jgi:hypothetical protein